jgi:DNA mismatch endonuclease Vsr
MKDRLSKARRSWNMSRIRGKHTAPEKTIRSLLHRLGYRFRLHGKSLPGRPDIVLPKYKTVIFVHGCFWHRHRRCTSAKRINSLDSTCLSISPHGVLKIPCQAQIPSATIAPRRQSWSASGWFHYSPRRFREVAGQSG